jgi:hypothetical protein
MKKITLLLMTLMTMVVNAKTFTTTLWEGSSVGDAEINIAASNFSSAKSGDAIRVTFSFTAAGSMHLCYKTGEGDDWSAKAFNSISEWPYYSDTNVSSAEFSINATDLTILQTYGMYIYGFTSSTITKVELTGEVPTTDETELIDANWTASWTAKTFAAQSNAKIGDVIRFSYSAPGSWSYFQFNILDAYGNADAFTNTATNVGTSIETAADLYFDFEITNVSDMLKIQNEGFGIKGDNFTLTSVKLLTYADSYDAVEVEIGEDGIATWSYSKNLDFTGSGITAYYASAVTTGSVTLTATATTWNYCGYILKGDEGKYTIRVVSDSEASYPAATYLKAQVGEGNVEASTTGKYHYIFAKKTEGDANIGFYKLTAKHTLGAKKAYLETETDIAPTSGARVALIFDDDTTTGIADLKNAVNDSFYYNMNGMRVERPAKGLYIHKGKKIIIK